MSFKPDRHSRDADAKFRRCVRCKNEFYVHGNVISGHARGVLCPDCVADDEEEQGPPDLLDLMEDREFSDEEADS